MWPRDRGASYLLAGRVRIELWERIAGGISLAASVELPQDEPPHVDRLIDAFAALEGRLAAKPVTVLLESAWLPVTLAYTGGRLLRARQVDALVRHRLSLYFPAGDGEPVDEWELRVAYRAGSPAVLGYGLPSRLKQCLLAAAKSGGFVLAGVLPASSWGRGELKPARRLGARGWWLWKEQDRALIARIEARQMTTLNAGVAPILDQEDALRAVAVEEARNGIHAETCPIVIGGWTRPASDPDKATSRVTWLALGGRL